MSYSRVGAQFPYLSNTVVSENNFGPWVRTHTWHHFLRKWLVWISTQERLLRTLTPRGCYCFNFGWGPSLWDGWDRISLVVSPQLLINTLLGILNQGVTWSFDTRGFTLGHHAHTTDRVPVICNHLATRHFYRPHLPDPKASPLAIYPFQSLIPHIFSFSISSCQLDSSCQFKSILKLPFGSGVGWVETTLSQSYVLLRLLHFLFLFAET